jgi:hypothetical protein
MCDPASLIGGVISMAASAMQARQQQQYQNEINRQNQKAFEISRKARQDELARQSAMEAQAANNWQDTTTALSRDDAEATQSELKDDFVQDVEAQPKAVSMGELLPGQQFASEAVKGEIGKAANAAAVDTRRRIEALAQLSAFGGADLSRGTTIGQNADFLTTLSGIRRGSLGVSQQEQNIAPAQVHQGSGMMADLLSGAGGLVSGLGSRTPTPTRTTAPAVPMGAGLY